MDFFENLTLWQNVSKWPRSSSMIIARKAIAMVSAKTVEMSQMPDITSLAHIIDGLALREM